MIDGRNFYTPALTIGSGTALSGAVNLNGAGVIGISMPAGWDAAALTFQTSLDGVSYQDVYDAAGVEYQVQAAAGRMVIVAPADFAALRWVKVRSGTAGTPVNQTAERVVTLVVREL